MTVDNDRVGCGGSSSSSGSNRANQVNVLANPEAGSIRTGRSGSASTSHARSWKAYSIEQRKGDWMRDMISSRRRSYGSEKLGTVSGHAE